MRGIRQSYCEDMDRREPWKPLHTILTSHPDTSTSRNLRVGNFHLEAPTRQSCPVRLNGSCILLSFELLLTENSYSTAVLNTLKINTYFLGKILDSTLC